MEGDISSGSDSRGDGEGADKEGERNDDEEGRKDSGRSGVDGDNESDLGEGIFCDSSASEVEGEGGEEVSDGIAGTQHPLKRKGRKKAGIRSYSFAEHVSSGPGATSKRLRGRVRTPNVRISDQ